MINIASKNKLSHMYIYACKMLTRKILNRKIWTSYLSDTQLLKKVRAELLSFIWSNLGLLLAKWSLARTQQADWHLTTLNKRFCPM